MADEIKPARNAADSAAGGEVSEDGKKMIEIIKGMKIVDLNNTVKAIEQEFGVSAQAPVAASASAGATADKEEKSSFNIELKEVGAKKNAKKEEADEIKKKFEAAGAKVELK